VTDELQPRNSAPETDAIALPETLQSLGFTFGEESPVTQPVEVPLEAVSTTPAPLSRRALREAEKSSSRRRGRAGGRKDRRASTTSAVASPAVPPAPIDPADVATAPLAAVDDETPAEAPALQTFAAPSASASVVTAPAASAPTAPESSAVVGPVHPASSRGRRRVATRTPASRPPAAATAPARTRLGKRVAQKSFPPIVMAAAAALLIGTSVPPGALLNPDAAPASAAYAAVSTNEVESTEAAAAEPAPEMVEDQVLEIVATENVAAPVASRDDWSVTSYAEMLRLKYGTRDFSYSTNGEGAVRWPFPVAVPISSGFGDRAAPCFGCSSYHRGLDMVPGRGTPIYSIADGIVTGVGQYSTFGYRAEITSVINGQEVKSLYAHMEWDSSPLKEGQEIPVGTFIGAVGNSGLSTGPHLHLEIAIDGINIDPFAWLTTNAS
jgi:murein DD-endopeptidase MepM/ murein hydrolase activator NlpD